MGIGIYPKGYGMYSTTKSASLNYNMKIHMSLINKAVQNVNVQSAVNSFQFTVVRLAEDD